MTKGLSLDMKLREKYKTLNDADFVKKMIVSSVYGTMQLEGQSVSKKKIESLYEQVKSEKKGYCKGCETVMSLVQRTISH